MNYVFYDFETTGLDTKFSQPIQIAAIAVDEDFNQIDDPINVRCRLKDGVIPNPSALLVHKVPIDVLKNEQSFYSMMDFIHNKFSSWGPATFIGYNSIRFDEEVLRSSFFQSLYDPYLTNTNNNTRTDLFKIILGLSSLDENILNIPMNEKNKPSYKLENIAKNNNIEHLSAHDALSDVYATIGIAKIIKEKSPAYWNECMKISSHKKMMEYLISDDYFFAASEHSAANLTFKPISLLTANPNNQKELAFFDLENDPKKYCDSSVSGIISLIESKQKIVRLYQSNKSPIIISASFLRSKNLLSDKEDNIFKERSELIKNNDSFINKLNHALVERYEDFQITRSPSDFLEEQIYNGEFYSSEDKQRISRFKQCNDPEEKFSISKDFKDRRLREICYRILFAETPSVFPENDLKARMNFIADKVFCEEEKVPWCTLEKAKEELEKIKNNDKFKDDSAYICEIEDFLSLEEERYKKYIFSSID
ncbi:MAG: exonuclease domain-containing protein [Pseudomonadota bacterium]|nr:exonuclease domain-containing protein [Pseudomonadota bacterium]|tara:strand:+ start:1803 stop:3242 length:1440 start_codon:yes stop_codon:yes gene_type:complete